MNLKRKSSSLLTLFILFLFMSISTFAQTHKIYVDATNGNDLTNSGLNPTNSVVNAGPLKTIKKGIQALNDGDTLVIFGNTYNGIDGAGAAYNISGGASGTYTNITSGFTIQLRQLPGTPATDIVDFGTNGLTLDIPGTLKIIKYAGSESLRLNGDITLTNGSLDITNQNDFVLTNAATVNISINGTAAFKTLAPKLLNSIAVNLSYLGGSNVQAGPEAYASLGAGKIIVNKTTATSVTFSNAINIAPTSGAAIDVQSGDAIFNSDVTVGTGDVQTAAVASNVTFKGNLNLTADLTGGLADANLGSIKNLGSGTILVNGLTTWTGKAGTSRIYPAATATYLINNAGTAGIVTLNGITLLASNSAATQSYTVTINNASGNTLTTGVVSTPTSGDQNNSGIVNLVNAGTASTTGNFLALTNTGALTATGAISVSDVLTNNNATSVLALGANTLTLSGAVANLTNTGKVTATTGGIIVTAATSFDGGTLPNVTVNTGTTSFITNPVTAGNITINNAAAVVVAAGAATSVVGDITVNSSSATALAVNGSLTAGTVTINNNSTVAANVATGVTLTTTNFAQNGGTFTLTGTGILAVSTQFNRTTSTFTSAGTSTVKFIGTGAKSFNPGPSAGLTLTGGVEFVDGTTTVVNTFRAGGAVKIDAAADVELGSHNIILNVASASIVNAGAYNSVGSGGVIVGGVNSGIDGGLAVAGVDISGAGVYSNIIIDAGPANTVTVTGAVTWKDALTLVSGTLSVNALGDLSPVGTAASVVVNVATALPIAGAGTFNHLANSYDLTYNGAPGSTYTVGSEVTTQVKTWTINTDNTAANIVLAQVKDFKGTLVIANAKAKLSINTGITLTLSQDGLTHTVKGAIIGLGSLIVDANAIVNGSAVTTDVATVGNLTLGDLTTAKSITVAGLKGVTGTLTARALSVVNFGLGSTAATQQIAGVVTLGGTSFTLTTNVEALGSLSHTAGAINSGDFNLTVSGGAIAQTAGATISQGKGWLVANDVVAAKNVSALAWAANVATATVPSTTGLIAGQTFVLSAGTLSNGSYTIASVPSATTFTFSTLTDISGETPTANFPGTINLAAAVKHLQIATNNTLVSNTTVSDSLKIGTIATAALPVLTLGTTTLTVSGNSINFIGDATVVPTNSKAIAATGAGKLSVTGAAAVLANNVANATVGAGIDNLEVNSTGSLTLASSGTKIVQVVNQLTQTKGDINTGANILLVSGAAAGAYTRIAGNVTSADAGKIVLGFTNTNATFVNTTANVQIDNLEINANSGSTYTYAGANKNITVAKKLLLTSGIFTTGAGDSDGKLILADSATIIKTADVAVSNLGTAPTFGASVNVIYNTTTVATDIASGNEIPTSATVLKNLTVNVKSNQALNLGKVTTINSLLKLVSGTIGATSSNFTLASGATLELNGGVLPLAKLPSVTDYSIVYSATGAYVAAGTELQSSATIDDFTVKNGVTLSLKNKSNLVVKNIIIGDASTSGTIKVDTTDVSNSLALTGDLNVVNGTIAFSNTASSLTFSGAKAQGITLPAGATSIPRITLALTDSNPVVTVKSNSTSAANLVATFITFQNGILNLGNNTLTLPRPEDAKTAAGNYGLGYDRSVVENDATHKKVGHVVGNIARAGNKNDGLNGEGRFVYPLGTLPDTVNNVVKSYYRPFAITFDPNTPLNAAGQIIVNHVNVAPEGSNGLPVKDDNGGVTIGRYPNFYWTVQSYPANIGQTQQFNVEMTGSNLIYPYSSYADLRGLEQLGNASNTKWLLLATDGSNNHSDTTSAPGDTIVTVQSSVSLGGIVSTAAKFTLGIPVSAPTITVVSTTPSAVDTIKIGEGDTVKVKYAFESNYSVKGTIDSVTSHLRLVGTTTDVAGATFKLSTAKDSAAFTWTPGYETTKDNATFALIVTAYDKGDSRVDTSYINVTNVNQAPYAIDTVISSLTPRVGVATSVVIKIKDSDKDKITWTSSITPAIAYDTVKTDSSISVKFTPVLANIDTVYTLAISFTDGKSAAVKDTIKFNAVSLAYKFGDVDTSGKFDVNDAFNALRIAVGYTKFSGDPATAHSYSALNKLLADVDTHAGVTSNDAYWIMKKASDSTKVILPVDGAGTPKTVASAGILSLGKITATSDANVVTIPLTIDQAQNVNAFTFELNYNEKLADVKVSFGGLASAGWLTSSRVENGVIKLVAAGLTPATSGTVATLIFTLKNSDAQVALTGTASINANDAQTLSAQTVEAIPTQYGLNQNYPNPFNPSTTIKYQIPEATHVTVIIYDLQGQVVKTLVNANQEARNYSIVWDGRNNFGQQIATGMYIYRINAGKFTASKKLMLMK